MHHKEGMFCSGSCLSFNARTLVMQDISIFLNSNLPEKRYRMFKKVEVDELPDDSTDIFQLNMLDRYLDLQNKNLKLGQYQILKD